MPSRLTAPLTLSSAALVLLSAYRLGWRGGLLSLLTGALCLLLGRFAFAREVNPYTPRATPDDAPEVKIQPAALSAAAPPAALLEATMSGMREGVVVVDGSLRVVASNDAARAVFSPGAGTPAGQSLTALTRHPAIHAAYRAALEHGEDNQVKVEMLDAARRVYDLRVVPLKRDEARGALGVFFDITRLERLERVRQEFLSNVSHELRTPLTSIITFVETLEEGAIDDPQHNRQFVSVIHKNAARMRALVEDILELSNIESGEMRVDVKQVRLSSVAQEAINALSARAAERGVVLKNEVSPGAIVLADPGRLEQMLTNLVDNAVKFSRAGGEVAIRHEGGERDLVSVSDAGEGIPAEHLPRVFERFYRVDRARSRELGGTGLGLAIVKHLARAHGGEVTVASAPGEGSTFVIELPRAAAPDAVAP